MESGCRQHMGDFVQHQPRVPVLTSSGVFKNCAAQYMIETTLHSYARWTASQSLLYTSASMKAQDLRSNYSATQEDRKQLNLDSSCAREPPCCVIMKPPKNRARVHNILQFAQVQNSLQVEATINNLVSHTKLQGKVRHRLDRA
jgi:hypothetical protein